MPYYEDVLDHLGRAPREFGSLHIHVEPVVRGPTGEAVATVWLQSAFEPRMPGDSVVVISGPEGSAAEQLLGRFPVPSVDKGKVVRWSLPLTLPEGATELHFLVESRLNPNAQRVRTAWKLTDTIEIPKESELGRPFGLDPDEQGSLVRAIFDSPMRSRPMGPTLAQDVSSKRHAARKLPPAFIAEVMEGRPAPHDGPDVEVVWAPGRRLPAPPPLVPGGSAAPPPPRVAVRTCFTCGFEGPRAEYERTAFCPRCDAVWD